MKIAILEDNVERQDAMRACLADRLYTFEHRFFVDAPTMIRFLDTSLHDVIALSLDHDLDSIALPDGERLDPGTGRIVAEYLAQKQPVCPVLIHTSNADAAVGMKMVLRDARWQTRRVVPFDDLAWIQLDWFPSLRRAIVGPTPRRRAVPSPSRRRT